MKKFSIKPNAALALKINLFFNTLIFIVLVIKAFPSLSIFSFFVTFLIAPTIYFAIFFYRPDRFIKAPNNANRFSIFISYFLSFLIAFVYSSYEWNNYCLLSSDFLSLNLLFGLTMNLLIQIIKDRVPRT